MVKLYLDICTLCRPFDDQRQTRIVLETNSYLLILQYIVQGSFKLVISPVHKIEIASIPNQHEKSQLNQVLNAYGKTINCNLTITRKRAEDLTSQSFGIADAAHLAFAEAGADVFITCDDKLIKKYRKLYSRLRIMNPVEFCLIEELR